MAGIGANTALSSVNNAAALPAFSTLHWHTKMRHCFVLFLMEFLQQEETTFWQMYFSGWDIWNAKVEDWLKL